MNLQSTIESRQASYAGVTTRELTVSGDGPTVVLIHGYMHSANAWRGVMDLLHGTG